MHIKIPHLILFISGAVLVITGVAYAGQSHSATGWAWGGGVGTNPPGYTGMGWISFNALSDGTPPGKDYGVDVPPGAGDVTGHAWNEYYGWISFNQADVAGCVPALGKAERMTNDTLRGGARILAIKTAQASGNAGGYDGCISLFGTATNGASYGVWVNTNTNTLEGYAWSSDLGWIDMSGVSVQPVLYTCQGTLPPSNAFIYPNDATGLTNNTTNLTHSTTNNAAKCEFYCEAGYTYNGVSCVGGGLTCQGTIAPNAVLHPNETTGLSGPTSYTYNQGGTYAKCEYYCPSGYSWNGVDSCDTALIPQ